MSLTRTLAILVAALGLAAAACFATDGLCPCGSDPEEPLVAHEASFDGDHLVANECVCQCGEDPVIATPKADGECPSDGQACTDELGIEHALDCY